ncbi:coiled-coil domain-containing protein [Tichowtungia aerotolerans]|uniref:Uncharacterized protein n=1 Tax=Tichowtungia aerotolerans TaxID=2697043 RepID=A0A6P1M9S4_9BACT|nr:hypothetical protein [Tichowtungia aerotolerans]QHI69304.1 hypothetical protein GT409_07520 [Tichowtungia aerotolerans]
MRRSILVVMIDVMVLSVLALSAGNRAGGENKIPMPLYRWSTVVEEGLRKEQAYQDEVKRLEEQLSRTSELAEQALAQAEEARDTASRERSGSQEMQTRLHEMELTAEKARAAAQLAKSEAQMAQQTAEEARRQAEEAAQRRAAAEKAVLEAQKTASDVTSRISELQTELTDHTEELAKLRASEAAAKERALALEEERSRLAAQNEQFASKMASLSGEVAALEVQKQDAEQTVAQLEKQKQAEEAERKKSIWVRRDESLRRLNISYTEYNSSDDRNFVTRRELVMPLVQVGRAVLVPADFRKLGLARSFFGGLSESVTQVDGSVSSLTGAFNALPLESIVVPGAEPQVCLVRFTGALDGALQSITMETLKERRIKDALLFSPDEVNEHGRVEVSPIIGSDYLTVLYTSGKKPKVGDYLLTDRGEFIGVMVTKEECYVMPQVLSRTPAPISIPIASRTQDGGYFDEFINSLNRARKRMDDHLKIRKF